MTTRTTWVNHQRRIGWILATTGFSACVAGIAAEARSHDLPFDPRIITGLGILLLGLAGAALMRGGIGFRSSASTRRFEVEDRDERNVAIRRLAGSRAYVASAAVTYALLMWVSFSANGQLPPLTPDGLWYTLAAAVVVPALVYLVSFVRAEHSM